MQRGLSLAAGFGTPSKTLQMAFDYRVTLLFHVKRHREGNCEMNESRTHPLITIIVPIYRVEQYLDRCVKSLVNQTYTKIEILLVDDGSPDSCPMLCEEWGKRDTVLRCFIKRTVDYLMHEIMELSTRKEIRNAPPRPEKPPPSAACCSRSRRRADKRRFRPAERACRRGGTRNRWKSPAGDS